MIKGARPILCVKEIPFVLWTNSPSKGSCRGVDLAPERKKERQREGIERGKREKEREREKRVHKKSLGETRNLKNISFKILEIPEKAERNKRKRKVREKQRQERQRAEVFKGRGSKLFFVLASMEG